jgi:hypothetical protein
MPTQGSAGEAGSALGWINPDYSRAICCAAVSDFVDCVGRHESSSPYFNTSAGDSLVRLATKSLTTARDDLHE